MLRAEKRRHFVARCVGKCAACRKLDDTAKEVRRRLELPVLLGLARLHPERRSVLID